MPTGFYSLEEMADFMRDWDGATWTWEQGSTITYNVSGLTDAAKTLARVAFQIWDEASGLSFAEVETGGAITLDDTNAGAYGGPGGWYYLSDPTTLYAINVQQGWNGETDPGFNSYTLQTFLHEIGHVLGMGHSGHYNGSANYANDALYVNDTWQYTVMSYFGQYNYDDGSYRYLSTPMLADYYYMEMVYGADTTTRTGDTVYGFNSNAGTYEGFALYDFASYGTAPALTIFDSAGTDTLDASGYGQNQMINLEAGTYSDIGGLNNNIGIAHNALIENAIGGSGNDTINGNGLANLLKGNAGTDTLNGGAGDDTLDGGLGADVLDGGEGVDLADYSTSGEAVTVNLRLNTTAGGTAAGDSFIAIEGLIGSDFADILTGGNSDNVLRGGAGSDRLFGNSGADHLLGGDDDDTLNGGAGDDVLQGGSGKDILIGGLGGDTFVFTSLSDSDSVAVRDVIRDFLIGSDRIDVSALGFSSLGGSFTGEAGELALVVGTNTNLLGDIDGDRVADFRLLFTGAVALTLDDFVL